MRTVRGLEVGFFTPQALMSREEKPMCAVDTKAEPSRGRPIRLHWRPEASSFTTTKKHRLAVGPIPLEGHKQTAGLHMPRIGREAGYLGVAGRCDGQEAGKSRGQGGETHGDERLSPEIKHRVSSRHPVRNRPWNPPPPGA